MHQSSGIAVLPMEERWPQSSVCASGPVLTFQKSLDSSGANQSKHIEALQKQYIKANESEWPLNGVCQTVQTNSKAQNTRGTPYVNHIAVETQCVNHTAYLQHRPTAGMLQEHFKQVMHTIVHTSLASDTFQQKNQKPNKST